MSKKASITERKVQCQTVVTSAIAVISPPLNICDHLADVGIVSNSPKVTIRRSKPEKTVRTAAAANTVLLLTKPNRVPMSRCVQLIEISANWLSSAMVPNKTLIV